MPHENEDKIKMWFIVKIVQKFLNHQLFLISNFFPFARSGVSSIAPIKTDLKVEVPFKKIIVLT